MILRVAVRVPERGGEFLMTSAVVDIGSAAGVQSHLENVFRRLNRTCSYRFSYSSNLVMPNSRQAWTGHVAAEM